VRQPAQTPGWAKNSNAVAAREIRFGGKSQPPSGAAAPVTDPLATLLGKLSWKYVKPEAEFDTKRSFTDMPAEELKEYIAHWAGRVWFHANPMPTGPALREFDLMSLYPEYREYIRAHGPGIFEQGMTLEEIWGSAQLFSAAPMVALATNEYADLLTPRIDPQGTHRSQSIVWFLGALSLHFPEVLKGNGFNLLVTDGKIGHTIYIKGLNGAEYVHPRGPRVRAGWFSIHDPWPARSLLAPERRFKGVQLLEDISRPPLWLISPEDLDRIVTGFLLPIDVLPMLLDLFKSVDMAERLHAGTKLPLWLDDIAPDPTQPFSILLAMVNNVTPTTAESLNGLGQVMLLMGNQEAAGQYFEEAKRLGAAS